MGKHNDYVYCLWAFDFTQGRTEDPRQVKKRWKSVTSYYYGMALNVIVWISSLIRSSFTLKSLVVVCLFVWVFLSTSYHKRRHERPDSLFAIHAIDESDSVYAECNPQSGPARGFGYSGILSILFEVYRIWTVIMGIWYPNQASILGIWYQSDQWKTWWIF